MYLINGKSLDVCHQQIFALYGIIPYPQNQKPHQIYICRVNSSMDSCTTYKPTSELELKRSRKSDCIQFVERWRAELFTLQFHPHTTIISELTLSCSVAAEGTEAKTFEQTNQKRDTKCESTCAGKFYCWAWQLKHPLLHLVVGRCLLVKFDVC